MVAPLQSRDENSPIAEAFLFYSCLTALGQIQWLAVNGWNQV